MKSYIVATAFLLGSMALGAWATDPIASPHPDVVSPTSNTALSALVLSAVDANPRVQAARSALNASNAYQSAAARPLYNPELELGAENTDIETRTVGISQTIDWSGKRSARTNVASAELLVAESEYLATRRTVTVELLSGLAAHETGIDRDKLASERVRLMQNFSTLAKQRAEAGDITQVELNLAMLLFVDARMKRATTAGNLADARQQVANITPLIASTEWPSLDFRFPELHALVDRQPLLMALPEVQVALHRVESANATVTLRKREKRLDPTVSLTGGEENGDSLVGLNLTIPLPVRNSFSHEVTAAYAQYQQAQRNSDDVLRRAQARLENASERYQIAQSAWQDWQEIGQSSLQQQGEQLRRLWEANELSTTEFLVQIDQTIDSQDSALDLRQTLWLAWFERLSASGQVDVWLGRDSEAHRN